MLVLPHIFVVFLSKLSALVSGWVNEFLSWKGFVPLSRMTYCAYLVHIPGLLVIFNTARHGILFTDIQLVRLLVLSILLLILSIYVCLYSQYTSAYTLNIRLLILSIYVCLYSQIYVCLYSQYTSAYALNIRLLILSIYVCLHSQYTSAYTLNGQRS